jgi:hypothetical protein
MIGTHEDIPDEQDPTPSVAAYNESFGTSFKGELLSVGGQVVGADGGSPKFSVLWKSPKLVSDIGGDALKKTLRLSAKTTITAEKQTSSSLQKSLTISDSAIQGRSKTFNPKGLLVVFIFISCKSSYFPY